MIDIGNKIFDTVFNAVKDTFPNADVTTGYDPLNAIYPCVVVEETGNTPLTRTSTDDCAENHSRLTYEVSIYTNTENSAKAEGRRLIGIVDEALQGLKFRRLHKNRPINISQTVFRQYGRWEVVAGKPVTDGENTVYQMYRR